MKKTFVCSFICHNGIVGGGLTVEEQFITYKTNKLTVDKRYRNLALSLDEVSNLTWKWIILPVATLHMTNGERYRFIIFNKKRFQKYYAEVKQH